MSSGGVKLLKEDDKLKCSITKLKEDSVDGFLKELPKGCKVLPATTKNYDNILIAADLDHISRAQTKYVKSDNVGVLVSRLQKCIRRGRQCPLLLKDTVEKLSVAPQYNLPSQQFIRVSGSRQLVWRLFISIIEDCEPYAEDPTQKYFSMLDIFCLALLTQGDPDVQFNRQVVDKLVLTALLVQSNDKKGANWDWRKGKEVKVGQIKLTDCGVKNSLMCALHFMPMMKGDSKMIAKSVSYLSSFKLNKLKVVKLDKLLEKTDKQVERDAKLASYDMHCMPNMILYLQASLPFIPHDIKKHTTKKLSGFIWEHSSKYNVRNTDKTKRSAEDRQILESLQYIQKSIEDNYKFKNSKKYIVKKVPDLDKGVKPNAAVGRTAFLLLFGEKVRLAANGKKKALDIVVAGTTDRPCKVKRSTAREAKYLDSKERYEGELRYLEYMGTDREVVLRTPPRGFKWKWSKNKVKIGAKLVKTNVKEMTNQVEFYAGGVKLEPFDAGKVLIPLNVYKSSPLDTHYKKLIKQALYYDGEYKFNQWELNVVLGEIGRLRVKGDDCRVFDWVDLAKNSDIPQALWRTLIVKLYNNSGEVQIGPVDRGGGKIQYSISYLYEGLLLRMFNLLAALYSNTVKPKGSLKFVIDRGSIEYTSMMKVLEELAFVRKSKKLIKKPIKIKTKLWDHQKTTSEQVYNGMVEMCQKGAGDASNVGAGKTLTALAIISKLTKHANSNYKGFLILLPTTKLYKTWKDEINKHTTGVDIIEQNQNGSLTKSLISTNSIVITTLGRIRDHPLSENWQLVVIDECLSVQNRDALQTEEAWKQVICSQYGVIMMSATFFRSRFDKLFYMLKMLRSGLPEDKSYLDAILAECIVCNIPDKSRKWITQIHKFDMPKKLSREYTKLQEKDLASDKLYGALANLLYTKYDYVDSFREVLNKLDKGKKALIYSRSKEETDKVSEIEGVTKYPDKTGRHVVVSYNDGAYGLNDLVGYNVIVTRPPYPDLLPQMKGRLDRPGQKTDTLQIEYILVKDTIEEALLLRLEMANNFYKNHIMPLAEFYEIAVKKNNKKHKQIDLLR